MIHLKNKHGYTINCKTGFSWTNLFFGLFVPLFRGDLKWAAIQFVVNVMCALIIFFPITSFVFPFIYNDLYIKEKLQLGFEPADEYSRNYLISKNLLH